MPRLPRDVRKALARALGYEGFLDAPEDLRAYSFDLFARGLPDCVALPRSTEQVAQVLAIAQDKGIPVVPRGAGSSLTGGPVPISGGIAMAFTRMNQVLEISPDNRLARVQPGVVTDELKRQVRERNLFYPPDPTSAAYCTIGGNIATNAGGASGVKYGVTRDHVMGLTVALPGGEIIKTGGRCHKSVTGYDFTHFLCGSEGQLGCICEAVLKLIPRPEAVRTILGYFPNLENTAKAVSSIISSGLTPSTLELMDSGFLEAVGEVYGVEFPKGAGAALLAEVDGPESVVDAQAETLKRLFETMGAMESRRARDEEERAQLWKARRGGTAALVRSAKFMVTLDFAVPLASMPVAVRAIQFLASEQNIRTVTIGHAGDGNLHPMCIYDPDDPKETARFKELESRACDAILSLGGTLSGEHGIGQEKAGLMPHELGHSLMNLSRRVKLAFDPRLIMNPGKGEWSREG